MSLTILEYENMKDELRRTINRYHFQGVVEALKVLALQETGVTLDEWVKRLNRG